MAQAASVQALRSRLAGAAQARPGAAQAAAWRPSVPIQRGQAPQGASALGSSAAVSRRRQGRRHGAAPVQALFGGLSAVFKNDPSERTRKAYQARVDAINALEPGMQQLSDAQLRELTQALQKRAAGGEPLDSILVEAFAVRLRLVMTDWCRRVGCVSAGCRCRWTAPHSPPTPLPPPTAPAAGARGQQARAGAAPL